MEPMSRLGQVQDQDLLEQRDLRDSGGLIMLSKETPRGRESCLPMPRGIEEATTSTEFALRDRPSARSPLQDTRDLCHLHPVTTSLRSRDTLLLSATTSSTVSRGSRESIWSTRKSSRSTKNSTKSVRSARTFASESLRRTGLKLSLTN